MTQKTNTPPDKGGRQTYRTNRGGRKARKMEALAALTPEEQEARIKDAKRAEWLTLFLMVALFGWKDISCEQTGAGTIRQCTSGRVHPVKGFYGTNPETGQRELWAWAVAKDLTVSRKVIEAMGRRGFQYIGQYLPADAEYVAEWECAFVLTKDAGTGTGKAAYKGDHETEAMAICEAACEALKYRAAPPLVKLATDTANDLQRKPEKKH